MGADRKLAVSICAEPDAHEDEVFESSLRLRRELLQFDVDGVDVVRSGDVPADTKAVDVAVVGALLVSFSEATVALGSLVTAVRSWLGRSSRGGEIRLSLDGDELVVRDASSGDQERLISAWLERHAAPRDG